MNMKTIEDVFIHLLSDTYSAEKQLTRALAKLARATSNEKLSQAFHALNFQVRFGLHNLINTFNLSMSFLEVRMKSLT